jgi:DNA-binding protein HU-beta
MALNKKTLARALSERTDLSAKQAEDVVAALADVVAEGLQQGETISIAGFGKFSVSQRAARQGRHPLTGETVDIAPSRLARFSAASALRKRLGGEPDD